MRIALLSIGLLVGLAAGTPGQDTADDESEEITSKSLLPLHLRTAQQYRLQLQNAPDDAVTLREVPLTEWTNVRRAGGQIGHVFIWLAGETPVALGGIFSFPWQGVAKDRRLVHELHGLSSDKIIVSRIGGPNRWEPKRGLERIALPEKGSHVTKARFPLAARQISRRFSGYCVDPEGKRWELRVLPRPLIVYPLSDSDETGFGALFGMMGDTGNDLESGVLLESVSIDGKPSRWQFAPIRLTDRETFLSFDDKQIWKNVRTDLDTRFHDANHVYFRFQDTTVSIR